MQEIQTGIAEKLRLAGLRPTRQRMALAELLFGGGDRHVSAESLHREAEAARIPVSLATVYNTLHQFSDSTTVQFHVLSDEQIEFYVDRYQPYDKAGAYAIQEWIGLCKIEKIEGTYFNVMGLPVNLLYEKLKLFA